MAVQALKFTGFIEREDLISYKNLFVTQPPGFPLELEGNPLCEYLTNLDQAEYRLVSAENQELTQDVSSSWDKRVIAVPLLAAIYLGITSLFHEKLDLLPVNFYTIFHVAGVVACFVSRAHSQIVGRAFSREKWPGLAFFAEQMVCRPPL